MSSPLPEARLPRSNGVPRVREALRAMTAYTLEKRSSEVKLDQNESPFDLPSEVKEEILRRASLRAFNRYPDFELLRLRERLAESVGLSAENILAGNGSNELLFAAMTTFIAPGTPVVVLSPSFALYEKISTILGGDVRRVAVDPASQTLPGDALLAAIDACDEPPVVIVCSPNNPTGGVLADGDLERLLETGATIFLDRAYGDFALDSFPPLNPRLVTFSTFSKAWGAAGLRIGWLASTVENCREIRKVTLPYNLNVVSEEAALVLLERPELAAEHVRFAIAERERIVEALRAIDGIEPFPSRANFIAFRTSSPDLFQRLLAAGVLVRDVSKYPGLAGVLRVSIGTREENDRFLSILQDRSWGAGALARPDLDATGIVHGVALVRPPARQRTARAQRTTKETSIDVSLDLDGSGRSDIRTPVGFLSHMLEVIARHGRVDLTVNASGDTEIDFHHTVEDTGLVLGEAFAKALGEKRGIRRFASAYVPLDESLARVVVDFAGRPFLVFDTPVDKEMLLVTADFPFALVEEFFKSFANKCGAAIHVDLLRGRNGHHAAEAIFKAFAVALREAKEVVSESIPSTKGTIA